MSAGEPSLNEAHPRAIISYAHDDESHKQLVLELAQDLRRAGIDCTLDRFVEPTNWAQWMETEIRSRDWVVVVGSPAYLRRSRRLEEPGLGKGAAWEFALVRQALYDANLDDPRIVPVVFGTSAVANIPDALVNGRLKLTHPAGVPIA